MRISGINQAFSEIGGKIGPKPREGFILNFLLVTGPEGLIYTHLIDSAGKYNRSPGWPPLAGGWWLVDLVDPEAGGPGGSGGWGHRTQDTAMDNDLWKCCGFACGPVSCVLWPAKLGWPQDPARYHV